MKKNLLIFLVSTSAVFAQSDKKDQLPQPPFLGKTAAQAQWTVTSTLKTPEKEPTTPEEIRNRKLRQRYSPMVLTRQVMKDGARIAIFTTYEGGLKSEAWVVGDTLYESPLRPGEGIRSGAWQGGDFPEIYCVSPENFQGTAEWNGRKYYLYTDNTSASAQSNRDGVKSEPQNTLPQRVYIDPETCLPVVVEDGVSIWTYQFSTARPIIPKPDKILTNVLRDAGAPIN
jgi:hypothetical protein